MKNLLYTVLMMCLMLHVSAQTPGNGAANFSKRIYLVTLKDANGYTMQRGILAGTTDSTLLISPNTEMAIQTILQGKPLVQAVPVSEVHKLVLRRKGKFLRSAFVGFGIGAIPALLIAATTQPDPNFGNGFFRSLFMVSSLIGGAEVGAVAGAFPNAQIRINGSPELYKSLRVSIEGYVFSPLPPPSASASFSVK